ncbi:MAG: hypothetical protein HY788_13375 [Deltaproteobacteria bacterium]|nr:hypothetical protein [Deltaproteobacteria bacterium]
MIRSATCVFAWLIVFTSWIAVPWASTSAVSEIGSQLKHRVEQPLAPAEHLLRHDFRWTQKEINSVLETAVEKTVSLPKPIPVYVLYLTAWAEEDGTVQFRDDIYGRDEKLLSALLIEPPSPQRADLQKETAAN